MKYNSNCNRCDFYVMAPLDVINEEGKPSYLKKFTKWCKQLKDGHIDGVMIDVWWGLVEKTQKKYGWQGNDQVFKVMKNNNLKIVPVLSFHQCSGNIGDNVNIPIPKFVFENDVKLYFVDRFEQINNEYISFSYDSVKLGDRTPLEMYKDFMKNFKDHFRNYLNTKTITKIEVGLGPCGGLRYPSYLLSRWEYPASGSFQCVDEQFKIMFQKDAKEAGHPEWISPSKDIGDSYNQFLDARETFKDIKIEGKVAGIHWQYLHDSRCAEATAGYYSTNGNDGYSEIAEMFKENDVNFCFTYLEMSGQDIRSASDPGSLVNDVFERANKTWNQF